MTEVRGFLGTCGLARIFIKDYSRKARALTTLLRKDSPFEFGEAQEEAMQQLKEAVMHSQALKLIDYRCDRAVILGVDSSNIAAGFFLAQIGANGKRYFVRFGSIPWNERES